MVKQWPARAALLGMLFSLASCGYIGNPQAPALDIPSAVTDLRAAEYGDSLQVVFTIPMLTTAGLPLKSLRSIDLYAGPFDNSFNAARWAETAKKYSVPADGAGPYAFDKIPVGEWEGKSIALGVRATGPKGKVSSWSNFYSLNVGPPLATPTKPVADNTTDGVKLSWMGSGPRYRVFRWTGDAQRAPIGETDQPEYLDASAQFGTQYNYMVMAIEGETRLSIVSETASITPKDIFPPAVPGGVTAAGNNAIELAWVHNTEANFRGYNVYRAEGSGPFEKIAFLVEAPVFSDAMAQPGKMYRYAISARRFAQQRKRPLGAGNRLATLIGRYFPTAKSRTNREPSALAHGPSKRPRAAALYSAAIIRIRFVFASSVSVLPPVMVLSVCSTAKSFGLFSLTIVSVPSPCELNASIRSRSWSRTGLAVSYR